ncbi:MAG: asparaginase, partial [Alphaproteobacteria bacterium]|nr:asparaginase [Alphaproteobacteria bacterium]
MKKRALICNLGGTIGMVLNENGNLRPPESDAEFRKAIEKITSLSQFENIDFEFVTLSTKDSTNLRPEEYEEFLFYINRRQKDFDFIICPHGTDTMANTASAFSFGFYRYETRDSALFTPIIFTGSQKPLSERGGDSERNLISAIQTGIEADKKNITDVLIVFDSVVIRSVRTYKNSDHLYHAFDSVDGPGGLIGTISAQGVYLHNIDKAITSTSMHRREMASTYNPNQPPPNAKFIINVNNDKHRTNGYIVSIVTEPGITEESIQPHIRNRNCLGIILTTLGTGNIPEEVLPCLRKAAIKHHIPIFAVSPFIGGSAGIVYESAENASKSGMSFLGDQSSSVVWIKAHWILANGLGMDSKNFILNMQRIFIGEGTVSEDAEKIPVLHKKKEEDELDNFRTRILRNHTAIEEYRADKGSEAMPRS